MNRASSIPGVRFVVDSSGRKVAVQLDLTRHGGLWEDIYDMVVARERVREPRLPCSDVRKRLLRKGKLDRLP